MRDFHLIVLLRALENARNKAYLRIEAECPCPGIHTFRADAPKTILKTSPTPGAGNAASEL